MASRTLKVTINADDGASQVFIKVGNAAKDMGESIEQAAKSSDGLKSFSDHVKSLDSEINTVGQAFTGLGAGITAAVGVSVSQFAGLESAMANVATIAGQSDAWISQMTGSVRELAVELGTSPTGLADGLYDIIGSGIDASQAFDVLRTSAIAAKAGLTDTGTAASAITAVLKAYGLEAQEAGNISDILFKTVDSGVITFEQLANNLGNTIPLASQLGVSIEELGAAYSQLTVNGVQASQAETQIAALMRSTLNETEALTEAVREYGYESAEALIQAEGFVGFLQFLMETSGGSSAALLDLVGTAEAVNAALILSKNSGDDYIAMLGEMESAAQGGQFTMSVFETQMDTISGSFSRLRAELGDISISVGEAFAPFARAGLDAATVAIGGLSNTLQSLPGPLQAAAAGATGLAGGFSLLAGTMLLLLPRIVETRAALQAIGGFRGMIGLLTAAFNPLTLAITGAIGGFVLIAENMRRGAEDARNYAQSVTQLAEAVEQLRIIGDDTRADFLEGLQRDIDAAVSDEAIDEAIDAYERLDLARQGIDPTTFSNILAQDFDTAISMADDVNLRIGEALSNPNIDAAAYTEWVEGMLDTIVVTAEGSNIDEVFTEILTRPLSDFRQEADESTNWITGLIDTTIAGAGSVATAYEEIQASVAETAGDTIDLIDEILARQQELFEIGRALGGLDDPLSQASLAGLGGDAVTLAENMSLAAAEADNLFRIIVSNTNAIKSQAEQTLSWADGLIAVRGEWSRLDELVQKGLITGESGVFDVESQYAAAQDAYDSIAITTQTIADNLDAVQAIQAPLLAEAQERTARWTYELLQMDAAQQRVTLGWYDSATAAQAMEAQMLINAAAAGEMGAAGQAATQQFIEGAVAANPILEDMLTDLGLIARDHEGNLIINFDDGGARSEVDLLNESVRQLTDVLDDGIINGSIGMQVTGKEDVEGIIGVIEDVMAQDGQTVDIGVNVSFGDAGLAAAGGVMSLAEQLNLPETIDVKANVEGGEDVTELAGAIREIPPSTSVIVDVTADDSEARDIAAYWAGYNGITFAQIEVAIIGNAGGADGVLTTIDNVISGGKTGYSVTIDVEADTSALDSALLGLGIGGGDGSGGMAGFEAPTVYVNFVANDSDVQAAFDHWSSLDGTTIATISLAGDNSGAMTSMGEAVGQLSAIDGTSAILDTLGDNSNALASIGAAQSALAGIDGNTATVSINAVSNVGSVVGAAAAALAGIDGRSATTYIDTVYRTFGSAAGSLFGRAHGGVIPRFASGGMVPFWGGENGPEVAHFAGGGTAILPHEGMYLAPPMTVISPANANPDPGGDLVLDFSGANFSGTNRAEIIDTFVNDIAPMLERSIGRRFSRVRV